MADRRVLLVALTGIAASALIVLGYGWVTREPPEVDPVPPLIAQLKSSNPQVREAAADKLRQLGPRSGEAVPQLLLVLRDDQNQDVRFAAAQALANSGPAVMTAESELNRLMIFETNPGVRQALKGLLEGKP